MIRVIDRKLLDDVSLEARNSPRRRKNRNFHETDAAPAHRLLNAVEPGSYIAPHRHLDPNKDESFVVLRGKFGLVIFDGAGNVALTQIIAANGDACGADIPYGTWHSIVSLERGSVFFEAKAGPYLPFTAEEKAPWAPQENDESAKSYFQQLAALFTDA